MARLSFDLPDEVFAARHGTPDSFVCALRLAAAMHWYGRGEISHERAAAIAGLTRAQLEDALSAAGQDVFTVDIDSLDSELARLAERNRDTGRA
jgi:hypothetical protein